MVVVQYRATECNTTQVTRTEKKNREEREFFERVILAAGRRTIGVRGSRGLAEFLAGIRIERNKKVDDKRWTASDKIVTIPSTVSL